MAARKYIRQSISYRIHFRRSNLNSFAKWVRFLTGNEFSDVLKKRISSKNRIARVNRLSRQVIDSHVYEKFQPEFYKRTFRLRKSITTKAGQDGEVVTYFDPSVSPAKGTSRSTPSPHWSYAAFFLDPKFKTFIALKSKRYRGVRHIIRHRPFYVPLRETLQRENLDTVSEAIITLAKLRMPLSIQS